MNKWRASLNEHRVAWIIACCCIATIFVASTWPGLFSFKQTSPVSQNRQAKNQPPVQQQARPTLPDKKITRTLIKPHQTSATKQISTTVASKKKPLQSPETEPKKVTTASGNYYVQTGAFKEKSRARKLVSRMKEHGWNAIIVPRSGFHAVWVGPKNSRSGIENLQKSIGRTLNIKGFIVQKTSS